MAMKMCAYVFDNNGLQTKVIFANNYKLEVLKKTSSNHNYKYETKIVI